jgi:hypothetical protein
LTTTILSAFADILVGPGSRNWFLDLLRSIEETMGAPVFFRDAQVMQHLLSFGRGAAVGPHAGTRKVSRQGLQAGGVVFSTLLSRIPRLPAVSDPLAGFHFLGKSNGRTARSSLSPRPQSRAGDLGGS